MIQLSHWLNSGRPELAAILLTADQRLKTDVARTRVYQQDNSTGVNYYLYEPGKISS